MAVMREERVLRDKPFGAKTGAVVKKGDQVRVLDKESHPTWINIQALDGVGDGPSGWVAKIAVGMEGANPFALEKLVFASQCFLSAQIYRVPEHYLMAFAQMRSGIIDGQHPSGYGPFVLTSDEWAHFRKIDELGLDLEDDDYQDWAAQSLLFAAMTNLTLVRLGTLLASKPTSTQTVLAQIVGSKTAVAAIRAPDVKLQQILSEVSDAELNEDGINRDDILTRYSTIITNKTAGEVLSEISVAFQEALDAVRNYIRQVGGDDIEFSSDLIPVSKPQSEFVSASLSGNKEVRYIAADGSELVKKGGSISWRQNNPGNMSNGPYVRSQGAIGEGKRFAIFPSEQVGFAAIVEWLAQDKFHNTTLEAAMEIYAPPSENDTDNYIKFIENGANLSKSVELGTLSAPERKSIAEAIRSIEGWIVGTEITSIGDKISHTASTITSDTIARIALKEWDYWGSPTHNLVTGEKTAGKDERSDGYAEYVYDNYYLSVYKSANVKSKEYMLKRIRGETNSYAWSACAISFFMKTAGYTKDQFRFSENHSVYIRDAIKAKKSKDVSACFWGYRVSDNKAVPQVGDLIGFARGKHVTYDKGQAFYDKTSKYESHTDVVVAVRKGEIDVVGGNVSDSVAKKTLRTNPMTGLLVDRTFPWFVVMKRRLAA